MTTATRNILQILRIYCKTPGEHHGWTTSGPVWQQALARSTVNPSFAAHPGEPSLPDTTPSRGSLFAIGGREIRRRDGAILERFVSRIGGAAARLVVLSTASPHPEQHVAEYGEVFSDFGMADVSFFHQKERADADDPKLLDALDVADGLFFTGGNQLKLVTLLGGTAVDRKIHERYQSGLHVAGTSAGAAAMSRVMIARGKGGTAPRLGSIRMSPGLGLLPQIIVDQHFTERGRFSRLMTAVLCNASMLGLGLDEDTAFELDGNDRLEVVGSGSLTIIDASELQATNIDIVSAEYPAAFAGMRIHVLTDSWVYDLVEHGVEPPAVDPSNAKLLSEQSPN